MAFTRRAVLASAPAIAAARHSCSAAELQLPGGGAITLPSIGFGGGRPKVELLSSPDVCQGRCREQDFVAVRYVGRRARGGTVFDDRYAQRPLIYELGSFYLPGVDEELDGACVGSKWRFSWVSSPSLDKDSVLPPGTPIEMELELVTIKYSALHAAIPAMPRVRSLSRIALLPACRPLWREDAQCLERILVQPGAADTDERGRFPARTRLRSHARDCQREPVCDRAQREVDHQHSVEHVGAAL